MEPVSSSLAVRPAASDSAPTVNTCDILPMTCYRELLSAPLLSGVRDLAEHSAALPPRVDHGCCLDSHDVNCRQSA